MVIIKCAMRGCAWRAPASGLCGCPSIRIVSFMCEDYIPIGDPLRDAEFVMDGGLV